MSKELPTKYYVNYHVAKGEYNDFGTIWNPISEKQTFEDFTDFIKQKSEWKINAAHILSNLNYISFLYLDPKDVDNDSQPDRYDVENFDSADLYYYYKWPMIPANYLKSNYPDVYERLTKGQKIIIAWCMCNHSDSFCKEKTYYVDCMESRLVTSLHVQFLMMDLLMRRLNPEDSLYVPDEIVKPSEAWFWNYNQCLDVYFIDTDDEDEDKDGIYKYIDDYFTNYRHEIHDRLYMLRTVNDFCDNVIDSFMEQGYTYFPLDPYSKGMLLIAQYFIDNYDKMRVDLDNEKYITECVGILCDKIKSGELNEADYTG